MPIVQSGAINNAALIVPDLYVEIVPPQNLVINGVPTNRVGVVGTAPWGPVGVSTIIGNMSMYYAAFGPVMARKYDMGTQVATAVQQGASDFRCIRVTDGTDAKASVVIQTSCITVTALYSGTLGNQVTFTLSAGSGGSTRAVVALPGLQPELFDNITGTGNAFWVNLASAITQGTGPQRGPSQLVTATAGAGTASPTLAASTLSGGSDGTTTITYSTLLGSDTTPRQGMYALRGAGCGIALLADADSSSSWSAQASLGLQEGIYFIGTAAAGTPIANGTTGSVDLLAASGAAGYSFKLMHGDWIYWLDQTNNVTRLVSPQGFVAGRLANLSPERSSLNKPIYYVLGSQKSGVVGSTQLQNYATAELSALIQGGVDVICTPQPGGPYWGCRSGHNSSPNAGIQGDNYTRMTNFISATLAAGMGLYVGQVINSTLFNNITSTLMAFFQDMLSSGLLGTFNGKLPFNVICNTSNNPANRIGLGYVLADCQVQYQAINEKFIVNIEGGQTVNVTRTTLPSGQQ